MEEISSIEHVVGVRTNHVVHHIVPRPSYGCRPDACCRRTSHARRVPCVKDGRQDHGPPVRWSQGCTYQSWRPLHVPRSTRGRVRFDRHTHPSERVRIGTNGGCHVHTSRCVGGGGPRRPGRVVCHKRGGTIVEEHSAYLLIRFRFRCGPQRIATRIRRDTVKCEILYLNRLRLLWTDVKQQMESSECPVCLEEMDRVVWCTMPCGHRLCFPCLLRMWEHSRRFCPLCRHDVHDCLPPPRLRAREVDMTTLTDEAFEGMVRRMQAVSVVDNALRSHSIAPRNALQLRRSSSLRIVIPASPNQSEEQPREEQTTGNL